MRNRLTQAIKNTTVDYLDVRFEAVDQTRIHFQKHELQSISSDKSTGGIVRAYHRGGWGDAQFDTLDDLDYAVEQASTCAKIVAAAKAELATPEEIVDAEIIADMKNDPRHVSLTDKIKLLGDYNKLILENDQIESSDVSYIDQFRTVWFANTRGAYFREDRPTCAVAMAATARAGDLVQRGVEGHRTHDDFEELIGREAQALKAVKRAQDLLKAPVCPGGRSSVVLDHEMAGVFIHEAYGHLSESDLFYEDKALVDVMHLGRHVGPKELNVVDDGTIPGLVATQQFDDEGTPSKRNYLVKDGVLAGHLHSMETAGKMGETVTGNARANGPRRPPVVRMTNTFIDNGPVPAEEVFKGVDKGIYCCGMWGGNTQMELFTFSAAHGYIIENGQVGEMVRDVMLAGNVFQTMDNIDAIGDDLQMCVRGGQCGKAGQGIVVTLGSPHIRIRDVVVGGRQG